jgi:hypothetical protein
VNEDNNLATFAAKRSPEFLGAAKTISFRFFCAVWRRSRLFSSKDIKKALGNIFNKKKMSDPMKSLGVKSLWPADAGGHRV